VIMTKPNMFLPTIYNSRGNPILRQRFPTAVLMGFVLGFLLLVLTVACSSCNETKKYSQGKDNDANKEKTEQKDAGRYQLHGSPRDILLLDSATGRTWILSHNDGEVRWTIIGGGPEGNVGGGKEVTVIRDPKTGKLVIKRSVDDTKVIPRKPGETIPEYMKRTGEKVESGKSGEPIAPAGTKIRTKEGKVLISDGKGGWN
jgi:hypothetical protein